MKKLLLMLAIGLLVAGGAQAVIDEDENVIGLYFDTDADMDCLEAVTANSQVPCHIILTNPTFSDLYGYEVGFDYGSELLHLGTTLASDQYVDFGSGGNLIVGFITPTQTREATLLATLDMMYIDMNNRPTTLTLRGSNPTSLDPAYPSVLLADGEIISTGLHDSNMTYQMNGVCGFEDQAAAWDGVKSLYR